MEGQDAGLSVYHPLAADEIRLLLLKNNEKDKPLEATLTVHKRDEVPYDALSYRWGIDEPTHSLRLCDSAGIEALLPIRDNLKFALCSRRRDAVYQGRFLWVDAISINQTDNQEKSQQIHLMNEIYRNAKCVVSWLDDENETTESMFQAARLTIEKIKEASLHDIQPQEMITYALTRQAQVAEICAHASKDGAATWFFLVSVHLNAYFERQWIVQELLSGRERVMIQQGRHSLPLMDFWALLCLFNLHSPASTRNQDLIFASLLIPPNARERFGEIMQDYYKSCQSGLDTQRFWELLPLSRMMQCRDKQDKVLAIISLDPVSNTKAKQRAWGELDPGTLFLEVGAMMLESESDPMRLLIQVNETDDALPSPSWVPDWTETHTRPLAYAYLFTSPELQVWEPLDSTQSKKPLVVGDRLSITGTILFEDVQLVGDIISCEMHHRLGDGTFERLVEQLDRCTDDAQSIFRNDNYLPTGQARRVAVLGAAAAQGELRVPRNCPSDVMKDLVTNRVRSFGHGRRFAVLDREFLALVPPGAVAGDKVCIMNGSRIPCLLRPSADGHWQYVGWVHIHWVGLNTTLEKRVFESQSGIPLSMPVSREFTIV